MWGGCWGFYSSEAFASFLVEQALSLQSKSSSCRASLLLVGQVLSLQSKSSSCRASLLLVGQVLSLRPKSFLCRASFQESETWWASLGPRSVRGSTQRMGSAFYWPMNMGLLGSPSLISYFILFSCPLHPIWSVAFVQTVNWGDGQNKQTWRSNVHEGDG